MQFVEKKTANYRIKLFYRYGEMPNLTLDLRPKQTINQFCSHIYENMQQDTSCLAVSWDTPSSRDTGLRRRPGRRSRTCRRRSWTSRSRRRRRSTGNRLEKNIFYTVRYHWFRFCQEQILFILTLVKSDDTCCEFKRLLLRLRKCTYFYILHKLLQITVELPCSIHLRIEPRKLRLDLTSKGTFLSKEKCNN